MFGPAYFGTSHYGPTYFPPGGDVEDHSLPATHGGGAWPGIGGKKKKRDDEEKAIIMAVIKQFLELEG